MTKRLLSLMATLALLACGEPFAPDPASNGPGLGAIRVVVDMPGNGTFDYDGFNATSPFFSLPIGWFGGEAISPDLPEGLKVTVAFEQLPAWCHPAPVSRTVTIVRDDTLEMDFTVSCDTVRRPVRFIAAAPPTLTSPVNVSVFMPNVGNFGFTSAQPLVAMIPVNDHLVTTTATAPCSRSLADDKILHVPLFPPDTIQYVINLVCN